MTKKSIKSAIKSADIKRALNGLVGCPAGGWPETQQARNCIIDALPIRADRSYSVDDLIAYAMIVDHADRYQFRGVTQ